MITAGYIFGMFKVCTCIWQNKQHIQTDLGPNKFVLFWLRVFKTKVTNKSNSLYSLRKNSYDKRPDTIINFFIYEKFLKIFLKFPSK